MSALNRNAKISSPLIPAGILPHWNKANLVFPGITNSR